MEKTLKTKIAKVTSTNQRKDGTVITDKYGKTKWRVSIQIPEHGDKWLTGFLYFAPDWKDGDFKEIIWWEEEQEYNGEKKKQLFFKLPSKEDKVAKALESIQNTLLKHTMMLQEIGKNVVPQPKDDYPQETTSPEDIDRAFEAVETKGEDDINFDDSNH